MRSAENGGMFNLSQLNNEHGSSETAGYSSPKKKTGLRLFFDILGRKFWQLAGLNLLYFLFFMPLLLIVPAIRFIPSDAGVLIAMLVLGMTFAIIIGPATAGMTKVLRCYLIEKHTFVVRDFFRAFRANFKKASIIGFIDCIIVLSAVAAVQVYPALAVQMGTKLLYVPMVITYSVVLLVLMMNYYIYLMLVATSLSLKNLIKNSFALAFVSMKSNLLTTLFLVLILAFMYPILLYAIPLFMTLLPFFPAAFMGYIICFNSYPVIQKYVINPYYASIGEINPELMGLADEFDDEDSEMFEKLDEKERVIEKRKKGKGKRIS